MSARFRWMLISTTLCALCVLCAVLGSSGSVQAASSSPVAQEEQMQSAPPPEEPPGDEPEGDAPEEEAEEPVEGGDFVEEDIVEEEVTPPPLEPPSPAPVTPVPAPGPAAPAAPIVIAQPPSETTPVGVAPAAPAEAPSVLQDPSAMPTVPVGPSPVAAPTQTTEKSDVPVPLPSDLRKICARLASSPLATDPFAADYLNRLTAGQPSAQDMNDFGVLLGRKYYLKDAEAFFKAATGLDKTNTDYWLNLGTVRLQRNKLSSSLVAYEKALDLDPNRALTHYDIGVVHDYMRNYDHAVDSFTRALALDPSLGDPKVNPLAVNNDRLMVVNLLLYQAREGGLAMPLRGGPIVPAPPKNGSTPSKKSRS